MYERYCSMYNNVQNLCTKGYGGKSLWKKTWKPVTWRKNSRKIVKSEGNSYDF